MSHFSLKSALLTFGILSIPFFGYLIWNLSEASPTLTMLPKQYQEAGNRVKQDFESMSALPLTEDKESYRITDTASDGIDIKFINQGEPTLTEGEQKKPVLTLSFPKDYSQPLEVKLDDTRTITITDLSGKKDYTIDTLSQEYRDQSPEGLTPQLGEKEKQGLFESILSLRSKAAQSATLPQSYLRYTSKDGRKSLLYAFQKDQSTGEKKMKHWTLYRSGDGIEQEEYQFKNAKIKVNQEGIAEVYYFGDQDLKNQQAASEVDSNLMARAQRTLAKEMGEDLLNGNHTPDFTIPAPYYIDNQGNKHEAEWQWHEETGSLSVSFTPEQSMYPIALDPTLSFTAPGTSTSGSVITGEASSSFGTSLTSGDFNADGRTDLAVGASGYSSSTGRAYIFYGDGSTPTTAATADVTITGEASSYFGISLTAGDFNADGKTDLAVGAYGYSSNTGRAYIFYNDGSIPTTAATANVTITGGGGYFGYSLTSGDFNADGRIDFAVGAYQNSSNAGRTYLFYNDGSIPTTAATADVIITGEASSFFGTSLTSGDFNADGRTDLAVGAFEYSSATGRAYIFYNDGSIPTTAATADVIITGQASLDRFGTSLISGDFNADGRIDLAVGAYSYSTLTGRTYLFYNDGSIPTTAATADVTITGEATSQFGTSLTSGDFNADGRTDLAVGAIGFSFSSIPGRAYIFYNDGSIPTTAATADVRITAETTTNNFGTSLTSGDFNADGRIDLAVGTSNYSSTGRAYIFYSQNGQINTNTSLTGGASSQLGRSLTSGDFNADGRTDLAVGSFSDTYIFYNDGSIPTTAATADVIISGGGVSRFGSSLTAGDFNADGRTDLAVGARGIFLADPSSAYIFYNDGSIPTTAGSADVIITGEASSAFGTSLTSGDFNADGRTDLAVGAINYSSSTGRAYLFYNDGSIPTTAATADVIITGETTNNYFGSSLTAGDFNADGRTDLAVGASGYSTNTGRAYIFYNDGSIPTTAATADVTITGEASSSFGASLTSGDFNADGRTDLAVGAYSYSSSTGRAYIFYNDGSIPTTAATADVIITGETTSNLFGISLISGDFNADGRIDLAVGAYGYSTDTGRAYLFYNDGSIPTTAVTADVIITGETTSNLFGVSLTAGDFNADGRTDLAVGAYGYSSSAGRVYIYETRENFAWKLQRLTANTALRIDPSGTGEEMKITGEASSAFGTSLTSGDFNADGRTDLAVGARNYSSATGRVYIFYASGLLAPVAGSADVIITGQTTGNFFGVSLTAGDFNADGRTDLAVGAQGYSTNTGRAYIFYNDGSIPTTAATADVIITGGASNFFGVSLTPGDFNADGRIDLAVGAAGVFSNSNSVFIFYNDGSIPTTAATADVTITGEGGYFGYFLTAGDFNADGRTDLAVSAYQYSSTAGRAYIFYNDGSIPTTAATADVIITGEAGSYFGYFLTAGDFNADGRTDMAVGAYNYSSSTGRAYIFYNDGTIPTTAATADVIITGEAASNSFGYSLTSGDFNADGRTDLAVGASGYSTNTGRAYIFYNDGSIPTTAATADVTITGEATSNAFGASLTAGDFNADGRIDLAVGASTYSTSTGRVYLYTFNDWTITGETTTSSFGYSLTSGDFNADGRTDLAVGAYAYSTSTGRAYLFYNDGSIPTTAATADVTITGEASSRFGYSLTSGDFNADGRTDLAVGAYQYSSSTGRAYIFYNDGSIPTTAATADVIITGETTSNYFGASLTSGDFNADGRIDLVVGAYGYSSNTGRAYIFYNDGSIPTTAATADVTITGEATSNSFGISLTSGDFNADGRTDLAVGAYQYSSSTGRAYLFYNDGSIPTTAATADVIITGEATSNSFGYSLTSGDFNADGRTDLAVGAYGYSTLTGRTYIFYNDGSIPTTAATADVTITGEATGNWFGIFLTSGDFNADGRIDLVVGASQYSAGTGRAYVFYNDNTYARLASLADITITGQATNNSFGRSLVAGDMNSDGIMDLAVGSYEYISSPTRVNVFITEAAIAPAAAMNVRGQSSFRGNIKLK